MKDNPLLPAAGIKRLAVKGASPELQKRVAFWNVEMADACQMWGTGILREYSIQVLYEDFIKGI